MNAHNWRYAHSKSSDAKGWDSVFLPLSRTCTDESGTNRAAWGSSRDLDHIQVDIHLTFTLSYKLIEEFIISLDLPPPYPQLQTQRASAHEVLA